jgi:hypothetical protein
MKNLLFFAPFLFLAFCSGPQRPTTKLSPDISESDISSIIYFLASDSLRGREAGTIDEAVAANYIAT